MCKLFAVFALALLAPVVAEAQDFRFRQNVRYRETYRAHGRGPVATQAVPFGYAPAEGVNGAYGIQTYSFGTIYSQSIVPAAVVVAPAIQAQIVTVLPSPTVETRTTTVRTFVPAPVIESQATTTTYGIILP